jgi:hypothetical protein
MRRLLQEVLRKRRARTEIRRERALERAAAEMKLRENYEGSIWKSGKGGGHYDH